MSSYQLRETDLAFNPFQKRDGTGRWTRVGGAAHAVKAGFGKSGHALETTVHRAVVGADHFSGSRALGKDEVRRSLTLTSKERVELFEAAGLKPALPGVDETELANRFLDPATKAEDRVALKNEILRRQDALNTALATVHAAELESRRGERRRNLAKYDAKMSQSKVGRVLLKVRNALVSDGTLDKFHENLDRAKEFGKEWGDELATSSLASVLVGAAGALSSVLIGEKAPEVVQHFAENPVAEAGILAVVGITLSFGIRAVRKHAADKDERETLKLTNAARLAAPTSTPKVGLK